MGREFPTLTLLRSDGLPIVERCTVADTTTRRLRGLLGRPALGEGEGMVLRPAWGIHTAFLPAPIDVIFLGGDQTVLRIVEAMKPFRLVHCRGARDIVEARAGTCRERRLDEGHAVTWAAYSPRVDGAEPARPRPRPDVAEERVAPGGTVVLCSPDRDFLRLTRFLLEHHDVDVHTAARADQAIALVEETRANVLLLDPGAQVAEAGRVLTAVDALRGETDVVVVGDGTRDLPGLEIHDKWDVLDGLLERVEQAAAGKHRTLT